MRDGYLDDETYGLIQRSVPICTVDLLCMFTDREIAPMLLIERDDGHGHPGALNLVGGRIRLGESIEAAALRHVRETIGDAVEVQPREWGRPEWVAVYPRGEAGPGPHDPRQQSISPSYVVNCAGEPVVVDSGEATGLAWFDPDDLPPPDRFGFGQGEVVKRMLASREPRPH